jgi:gluconokinase
VSVIIVMGVSGCGKSTIGKPLAERLGFPFFDADEFHPPENVAKMAAGTALTDADRWPWLALLNGKLKEQKNAVLACSALKQSYRDALAKGLTDCRFVHLRGSIELIRSRLAARKHRYMPASLLESQFATLEPPADAIEIDIGQAPGACLRAIESRLDR